MKKPAQKLISISDLRINPNNPRFESVTNHNKALELMLEKKNSEIKKLAQDIIEHGMFNPSKNLMVIKSKNDKYTTLEGNRRVTAAILLHNPKKIKNQDLREFFQKLKDKFPNQIPNRIQCVVFEKEDNARHWIELEHTGKNNGVGVDPWDSEQQGRFRKKASRQILIFDFADKNGLNRDSIDSTNLERLLFTPHVCEIIGVSFSGGKLSLEKSKSQVKANIKKVFSQMSKSSFKVGDIYKKEQREQWIDEILGTGSKNLSKNKTKTSAKSTSRKNLIPHDCDLPISISKIRDIFLELRDDLNLNGSKSVPNAVGVLFRVFLEVSIDHYLKEKMKVKLAQNMIIVKKINDVVQYMLDNNIATNDQIRGIRQSSTSPKTDILHIQRFHEYVHSGTIQPDPASLKIKWENVQEFFEVLWNDLDKK